MVELILRIVLMSQVVILVILIDNDSDGSDDESDDSDGASEDSVMTGQQVHAILKAFAFTGFFMAFPFTGFFMAFPFTGFFMARHRLRRWASLSLASSSPSLMSFPFMGSTLVAFHCATAQKVPWVREKIGQACSDPTVLSHRKSEAAGVEQPTQP
jgi:hypothetical protein